MKIVLLSIILSALTFPARGEDLEKQFLDSLAAQQNILIQLIDQDPKVRANAIQEMSRSSYRGHITNYLDYYSSLHNYDLFRNTLNRKQIKILEKQTRTEYLKLLKELFGERELSGEIFFRFLLAPDEFFIEQVKTETKISTALNWDLLFKVLQNSLPSGFPYTTRLRIDPTLPGGRYDETKNEIVFGNQSPNISTLLGFIHEFGHSVFLVPNADANALRILAANESYAEIWANELLHMTLPLQIFDPATKVQTIEKYMRFRNLLSLRFHLFVLDMDRHLHQKNTNVNRYLKLSAKFSVSYLSVKDFPPALPIMPQMRIPGYLQSYLAIPFLKDFYKKNISQTELIKSLIELGPIVLDNSSEEKFENTLKQAIDECLNSTSETYHTDKK